MPRRNHEGSNLYTALMLDLDYQETNGMHFCRYIGFDGQVIAVTTFPDTYGPLSATGRMSQASFSVFRGASRDLIETIHATNPTNADRFIYGMNGELTAALIAFDDSAGPGDSPIFRLSPPLTAGKPFEMAIHTNILNGITEAKQAFTLTPQQLTHFEITNARGYQGIFDRCQDQGQVTLRRPDRSTTVVNFSFQVNPVDKQGLAQGQVLTIIDCLRRYHYSRQDIAA